MIDMITQDRKDRHDKHRAGRIDMINTGRKDRHDKHGTETWKTYARP